MQTTIEYNKDVTTGFAAEMFDVIAYSRSEIATGIMAKAKFYLTNDNSRSVIKVVRYGLNIQCFPDEHAVELVERKIAKQRERRLEEE